MKGLVAAFLLMSGLLVAGWAHSATVLGTGAIVEVNSTSIDDNVWLGFQFTTGSGQSNLQSIDMAMDSALTETYTFRLYLSSGNGLPASNTPLATYTASSISTTAYNNSLGTLTTITFGGALSGYPLAANTGYVLSVQGQNGSSQALAYSQTPATQLNSSGWASSIGAVAGVPFGTQWFSLAPDAFIFNLSATNNSPVPASIPTLSEWAQLMLALIVMTVIGWHFHRERSY